MTTIPPTAEEVDTWAADNGYNALQLTNVYNFLANTNASYTGTWWAYGYTQNDSTQIFNNLNGDPTSNANAAFILQEIVSVYGAVTVREYTYTVTWPDVTTLQASGSEQTRISNPANWIAIP